MTISSLVTALVVGLIAGALGRLVMPARRAVPLWLAVAVGVAAALLGTIVARIAGVGTASASLLGVAVQVGCASVTVILVAATTDRHAESA